MKLKGSLSKEHITDGLTNFKKLRPKMDHSSLITIPALTLILFIAFAIRVFPLRWEIQTGAIHLSEFDPYHQYSFTRHIVETVSFLGPGQPHGLTHTVGTQQGTPCIDHIQHYP